MAEGRLNWGGSYSIEIAMMREKDRKLDGNWVPFNKWARENEDADERDRCLVRPGSRVLH